MGKRIQERRGDAKDNEHPAIPLCYKLIQMWKNELNGEKLSSTDYSVVNRWSEHQQRNNQLSFDWSSQHVCAKMVPKISNTRKSWEGKNVFIYFITVFGKT